MKKIISGILLCFVLLSIVPTQVWAEAAIPNMSAYSGWDERVHTATANYTNVDVNYWGVAAKTVLEGTNPIALMTGLTVPREYLFTATKDSLNKEGGAGIKVPNGYYAALKAGSADGLANSENGDKPFDQSKLYMISDGVTTSIYHKPYGGSNNEDTVLIAVASGNNVYYPPGGFVAKDTGKPDDTRINTERGFINGVDVRENRPANTSYPRLVAVDQLKYNQKQVGTNQTRIDEIDQKLKDHRSGKTPFSDDEEEQNLINERDRLTSENTDLNNSIRTGTEATQGVEELTFASCQGTTWLGALKGEFFTNPDCIITIFAIIANTILKINAFILYITGNLFDYSIEIAVNSAEFLKRINIIEPTWAFVRDFLNMTFIFILLYISVQILLGKGNYSAKNSVARLVLVAILMNFSLFAAKIMVDASNVVSLTIYEGIKGGQKTIADRGSVSGRIMDTLGLSTIYNFGDAFNKRVAPGCGGAPGTVLTVGIFGSILMIITSLTFFMAAMLFFLRMLNIIVLFISSPLWIWGYITENSSVRSKTTTAWWNNMSNVIMFPIMYMLILYISLAMFAQINSAGLTNQNGERVSFIKIMCSTETSTSNGVQKVLDQLPLIVNFILVIGAMGFSIKYSIDNAGKGGMLGTGKLATNISTRFDGFQKRFTSLGSQSFYAQSLKGARAAGGMGLKLGGVVAKPVTDWGKSRTRSIINGTSNLLAKGTTHFENSPKTQATLAMLSSKLKDPKVFGETEAEATKRITEKTRKRQEQIGKVQARDLKPEDQEEWEKKNPGGVYKDYLENQLNKIEAIHLGKLRDAAGADGMINSTFIRGGTAGANDLIETTADGKTSINQEKLFQRLEKVHDFHTKDGSMLKQEKRWTVFAERKAKASLDEKKKALKTLKEGTPIDKKKKAKKDLEKQLEGLPEKLSSLDLSTIDITKYSSDVESYVTLVKKIEKDRDNNITNNSRSQADEDRIREEARLEIAKLSIKTSEKIKEVRQKVDNRIEKLQKDIESMEAKEKESKK